jgi:adenosylcobinamide-GDP ribazoletransferase
MKRFLTALSFLTTIPSPYHNSSGIEELGKAAAWFPAVGALIGGLVALIYMGLARFLPLPVDTVLSVCAWVYLTGGLHLDGLADSFDGLLNSSSSERRLEIMKDPRLGTFGALGLMLTVILKISVLTAMPVNFTWLAIPLAASTARLLLLWAARQPMARPDGLGAAFKPELTWIGTLGSVVFPLGLAVLSGWRGFAALVLGCICAAGIIRWARIRLGGLTGDIFGLMVESVEVVTLLVFVVHLK